MNRTESTLDTLSSLEIPIRLSCIKPNGIPLVISLWYTCNNGKILCASQKSSRLIQYLTKNPICGFEIAADVPPYKGTRGEGIVRLIQEDREEVLLELIMKYLKNQDSDFARHLMRKASTEMLIEITPTKIFSYDYSDRMKEVVTCQ